MFRLAAQRWILVCARVHVRTKLTKYNKLIDRINCLVTLQLFRHCLPVLSAYMWSKHRGRAAVPRQQNEQHKLLSARFRPLKVFVT